MSVQSEDAGAYAPGSDGVYETDYYPSLSIAWAGGLTNGFDVWVVNDAIEAYTSDEFGVGDPVFPVWTTSLTLEH